MIDLEFLKSFAVATLSAGALWFWKRLFGIEASLAKHKEHVSERYMPKEDILRDMAVMAAGGAVIEARLAALEGAV